MLRQAKGVFGELWAGVINAVGTLIEVAATLKVTGTSFIVGANKFIVNAATGNTTCSGTLVASGTITASEGVALLGTAADGVTILLKDGQGKALLATGETVPTNGGALYAKGCLFIDTNVATGTTGLYCNKGTAAACAFTAVTQA